MKYLNFCLITTLFAYANIAFSQTHSKDHPQSKLNEKQPQQFSPKSEINKRQPQPQQFSPKSELNKKS